MPNKKRILKLSLILLSLVGIGISIYIAASYMIIQRVQNRIKDRLDGAEVVFKNSCVNLFLGRVEIQEGEISIEYSDYCSFDITLYNLELTVDIWKILNKELHIRHGCLDSLYFNIKEKGDTSLLEKGIGVFQTAKGLWNAKKKPKRKTPIMIDDFSIKKIELRLFEQRVSPVFNMTVNDLSFKGENLISALKEKLKDSSGKGKKIHFALKLLDTETKEE